MRIFYWLPALLWAGLLFFLSAQSSLPGPEVPDYVSHFLAYAILGVLSALGLAGRAPLGVPHSLLWQSWLLATAYGVTDEFHQMYVPSRHATWTDVLFDGVGALSAMVLLAAMNRTAVGGKGRRQSHG